MFLFGIIDEDCKEKSCDALLEVVLCIPPVSTNAEWLLNEIALLCSGGDELLNYENWSPLN